MSSSTSTSTGTTLQLQYKDAAGNLHNFPYPFLNVNPQFNRWPGRGADKVGVRYPLFQYRFGQEGSMDGSIGGFGNDGIGYTFLDTLVPFNGAPTLRLTTDGVNANSSGNPGSIPAVAYSNITKRRLQTFNRGFGSDAQLWYGLWFYPSSPSASFPTTNSAFILHIYNRDGTNRYGGALWVDYSGSNLYAITTGNSWSLITAYDYGSPSFFPGDWGSNTGTGAGSTAGNWHYLEVGVDFTAKTYLYAIINEKLFDLSTTSLYSNADTSGKALHFSTELMGLINSSGYRWFNIADPAGGTFV